MDILISYSSLENFPPFVIANDGRKKPTGHPRETEKGSYAGDRMKNHDTSLFKLSGLAKCDNSRGSFYFTKLLDLRIPERRCMTEEQDTQQLPDILQQSTLYQGISRFPETLRKMSTNHISYE